MLNGDSKTKICIDPCQYKYLEQITQKEYELAINKYRLPKAYFEIYQLRSFDIMLSSISDLSVQLSVKVVELQAVSEIICNNEAKALAIINQLPNRLEMPEL